MAHMLLHQRVGKDEIDMPSSYKIAFNQINFATVSARALYLDSVEDLETLFYLRTVRETRLDPKYMENPLVDLRLTGQPAQSESE